MKFPFFKLNFYFLVDLLLPFNILNRLYDNQVFYQVIHHFDFIPTGLGLMTTSPLYGGFATGKYAHSVPYGTRASLKVPGRLARDLLAHNCKNNHLKNHLFNYLFIYFIYLSFEKKIYENNFKIKF